MTQPRGPTLEFWIAFGLSFGVTVALGFARFAYALVLPAMRADLNWSYAQAGAVNTANAVGYLVGAVLATPIMARGMRQTFVASTALTGLFLLGTGLGSSLEWLASMRFLSGVTGALAFISGGALASHIASGAQRSALLVGVCFAGGGLGILISGIAIPTWLERGQTWASAWVLLGVVSLLVTIPAAIAASKTLEPPKATRGTPLRDARVLLPDAVSYFFFACGYIAYMTFAIAYLRENGGSALELSAFWAMLGISSAATPFLWGGLVGRAKGGLALVILQSVLTVAALLALTSSAWPVLLVSSALFGSFLAIPGCVTTIARRHLEPNAWAAAIAFLTIVFAAGQIIGPIASGLLADALGGLGSSLVWSAVMTALGALVALRQR
jgi:predicted MFS family arabinose efflux permease